MAGSGSCAGVDRAEHGQPALVKLLQALQVAGHLAGAASVSGDTSGCHKAHRCAMRTAQCTPSPLLPPFPPTCTTGQWTGPAQNRPARAADRLPNPAAAPPAERLRPHHLPAAPPAAPAAAAPRHPSHPPPAQPPAFAHQLRCLVERRPAPPAATAEAAGPGVQPGRCRRVPPPWSHRCSPLHRQQGRHQQTCPSRHLLKPAEQRGQCPRCRRWLHHCPPLSRSHSGRRRRRRPAQRPPAAVQPAAPLHRPWRWLPPAA